MHTYGGRIQLLIQSPTLQDAHLHQSFAQQISLQNHKASSVFKHHFVGKIKLLSLRLFVLMVFVTSLVHFSLSNICNYPST